MPLHPQARAFLDSLATEPQRNWEEMSPSEARALFNSLQTLHGSGPELHEVENLTPPALVPLRVYRPSATRPLPALMYFHGGGWELGNLDTHDTLCRRIAHQSGCAVISVEYRPAPEHRFPIALEDCFEATRHVADHAAELGLDPKRLAVGGDSAGGNLAACVALKARDSGGPTLHSQWLIYPVTEARFDTASYLEFSEGFGLSRANMQWFWDQYVPDEADRLNPLAAPVHAKSLAGLPDAYVALAGYDVLRDEGETYASMLKAAGVPVTLQRYEGMLHGFFHFAEPFDDAKRAVAELSQALKEAMW